MSVVIPQNLQYSKPSSIITDESKFVEFQPAFGSTFTSNENILFKVSSSGEALDVNKSYLKFDLVYTDTGATTCTHLGGVGVIKELAISLGGLQVSYNDAYNVYCAQLYSKMSETRKRALTSLEGYTNTDAFSKTTVSQYGRSVYHSIQDGIFQQGNSIPLGVIQGGMEIALRLETLANVSLSGTPTAYTVSNARFVACFVSLPDAYAKSFLQTLASGRYATIPVRSIRHFNFRPVSTSTEQSYTVSAGLLESVRSILMTHRLSGSVGVATTDFCNLFTNNDLSSFNIQASNKKYPSNFNIRTGRATSGVQGCEHLMLTLSSIDNDCSQFNMIDHIESDTQNYIYYDFCTYSNEFATGISLPDGTMSINCTYATTVLTDDVVDIFVEYDSLISVGINDVRIKSVDLNT
jgi:hypothetical protein